MNRPHFFNDLYWHYMREMYREQIAKMMAHYTEMLGLKIPEPETPITKMIVRFERLRT